MMNIFIFLTDNNNKYFFLIDLFYLFVYESCFCRKTNRSFKMGIKIFTKNSFNKKDDF